MPLFMQTLCYRIYRFFSFEETAINERMKNRANIEALMFSNCLKELFSSLTDEQKVKVLQTYKDIETFNEEWADKYYV